MRKVGIVLSALIIAALALGGSLLAAEKKVVLMWVGKSGMTKRVATGFLQGMSQLAPNLEIVQRREIANMEQGEKIFKESETSSDGIIFLRSNGAEFLAGLPSPPKLPCFVGGCNNPQELGVIKNLSAPEDGITGVTYFIPYEKRFDVIKELFPNVKSVGLLLQKGHAATEIEREGTRAECARRGIAYREVLAENLAQLRDGAKELTGKVDLFIISSTGLVMDNVVNLLQVANPAKIPIFSYAADRAAIGATAELAADDEKLGKMLAESVVDVVVKNKPISQVPVKMDPNPQLVINESQISVLGLKLPESIMKSARLVK